MGEHHNVGNGLIPGRRWYDSVPNVAHAVHLTGQLPESIQAVIAKNLNDYIDYYRNSRRSDRNHLSVGVPKILGLYNAAYRKRWYDPNPLVRRAFTMMATVPESVLGVFAHRVVSISSFVNNKQMGEGKFNALEVAHEVDSILKNAYVSITQESDGIKLTGEGISSPPRSEARPESLDRSLPPNKVVIVQSKNHKPQHRSS